jgi:8-oxo-dGTP pyrophosphatase MutT (NUDIX family)
MSGPRSYDWYTRPANVGDRRGAGGVVVRVEAGQVFVALVKERELGDAYYVLPKGGLEPGESVDEGALREIHEEVGLTVVEKLMSLGARERLEFKKRYWQKSHYNLYYAEQVEGEILDKENHFDFGWFSIDDLPAMFWEDERGLIEGFRETIKVLAAKRAGQ